MSWGGVKYRVRCIGRPFTAGQACGWSGVRTALACECYEYPCRPTDPASGCPSGVVWPCPRCKGAVTGKPVSRRVPVGDGGTDA